MKKLKNYLGRIVAAWALCIATITVNSTCVHYLYQGEVPEDVQNLSKIK